jgi:transcriptional regulator with XRE-family HTH domain
MEPRPLRELLEVRKRLDQEIRASIRAERRALGMNQRVFGEMLGGTSNTYVSNIETGHKTQRVSTLETIAEKIDQERKARHGHLRTEGRAQEDVRKARRD